MPKQLIRSHRFAAHIVLQRTSASSAHRKLAIGLGAIAVGCDGSDALGELFVALSVVEQGHDLNNESIADREETRYPRDSSEYVRSKTPHAEKHSAGNQDDPYSERDPAAPACSPILLAGGRLHGRQDIPAV